MLTLVPLTPDNWREPLRVREDQRRYAADRTTLLARAYAYREAMPCYVDSDEAARRLYEKCGFALTGEADEDEIIMRLTL